jgi:transcriptional regulator with PAS, ATPase and Fis domain
MKKEWLHSLDAAITVCDKKGVIVYMNRKSVETFAKDGGKKLIGSNLLDCHTEEARKVLQEMLVTGKENIYSIEKNGVKKLIVQKPVYEHGNFDGFMEMSIVLPDDMENFKRS